MKFYETETFKKLKNKEKNNFPNKIIMHNSGGTDANPLADTSHHTATMMESWHLSKGWDGLGYTFVIHKNGDVWRGRPEHRSGAHTVNHNASSIGICLAGNFDATMPTKEQEEAFKELYRYLVGIYGKLPIHYHRDFAKKTCPGTNIQNDYFAKLADSSIEPKRELLDNEPEAIALAEKEATVPDTAYQYLNAPIGLISDSTASKLPLAQQIFEYIVYSSKDPNKIGATGKAVGALLATHLINPLSQIFPQLAQIDAVQAVQTSLFYFGVAYGVFGIARKAYYEIKSYLDKKKEEMSILQK